MDSPITPRLKVKGYSPKVLFLVFWLKKCMSISENIIVDEFSLAEKHLFKVEHVNTKFFSASVITKTVNFN